MAKKKETLDLNPYWEQAPDATVLYQVGEYFFFALHYAESYARLAELEIVTHQKTQNNEEGQGATGAEN